MKDTTLIVQVFTFAALVAGFIHQYIMKRAERKWADEMAKRLEEKAERDAAALAEKVEAAAREASVGVTTQATSVAMTLAQNATALAAKVTETAERLANKVEAGTEKAVSGSERAYSEANSVNVKIKDLQERLVKIGDSVVLLHEHVVRTETAARRAAEAADETCALNKKVDAILEERMKVRKLRKRK